jgi:hypothetical protein
MYHNGQIDAHAVRPLMTFMLSPLASPATFHREEPTFADIRQYLGTIEPPKYPFPVDADLVERGTAVFAENCANCHGNYGPVGAGSGNGRDGRGAGTYPNKVVPLAKIGTDPSLVRGLTPAVEEHFRQSWFTKERGPDGRPYPLRYNEGYQAPPLDGVWATAPYLHNGSVPTLHHLRSPAFGRGRSPRSSAPASRTTTPGGTGGGVTGPSNSRERRGRVDVEAGPADDARKVYYDNDEARPEQRRHTYTATN